MGFHFQSSLFRSSPVPDECIIADARFEGLEFWKRALACSRQVTSAGFLLSSYLESNRVIRSSLRLDQKG
jgi:hypothetical protein